MTAPATGTQSKTAQEDATSSRRPGKEIRASEGKWGADVLQLGFTIVPSLIFRAQRRLGLSPSQLAVLLQLADYWWDPGRRPFPSKEKLSDRLNLGPRQVQRIIADLEKAGFVKRVQRYAATGGKLSNTYDLSGLVQRLKKIAPDVRAAEAEARSLRDAAVRPGVRKRAKAPG